MAQYYQIVGQGPSLTLEDLQRYCPNICLDGIIVNQEDQQYGQQQVVVQQADTSSDIIVSEGVQPQLVVGDGLPYQQQYIIRHEPQQPTRTEFQPQQQQNQQQQQQQQQQALHRHQVYYTSDLPVDAQVVLQQAQQIIDASLMQQSSPQHPQHQLVSPGHVLSQPTVIHPAQQPPPQPPPQPATQQIGTPQNQQQTPQLTRASPQLIQHLQQQHQQQIHLQLQQQQQQQLQHQLQQQQQQQQQQHLQPQQIQHQQVVMHAAYINQQGTPPRGPAPRLLNQALNNTPGLTLVRTPVKTVRPRRPPARPALSRPAATQVARHLNPQLQQAQSPAGVGRGASPAASPAGGRGGRAARPASPRVMPPLAQHRPPRPRTPITQTPHQLAQHIIGQQVHQQQIQQQINQLKLTPQQQQIILNQQNAGISQATRIITPQGTIVTQGLQQMSQHNVVQNQSNGPLPQSTMNGPAQRASPHPQIQQQVKKVAVQPNNANEMDDLEESITAAIVQKHPINDNIGSPQQYHTPPPQNRQNHTTTTVPQHQLTFSPQHFLNNQPQQTFEQTHLQHSTTLSHLLMETDNMEEERQVLTFANGQRITLAEYKRLHQPARSQQQLVPQQQSETGRQTLVRSKEQPRPVQRVLPMQNQHQPMHSDTSESVNSGPSEQASEPQSAKMLIFLQNGEQRLITFTLPKESCTLQEVLEQVNVPFTEDTHIQCMQNTSTEIDYFVSVGATTRIEEMLENHPMLVGDMSSRTSPSSLPQPQNSAMSTPEKSLCPDNVSSNSPESPERRSPPPRYVDGMLAVCKSCGYTGFDFSRCQRCKRVFTEEPKSVPSKKLEQKKKEPEKSLLDKQNSCTSDGIKLNLLKTTVKTLNNKTQEKKPTRVRKPKAKPDPEPVILTLSSDEEDSNSSMLSNQHEISVNIKEPTLSEIEGTSENTFGLDHMDDGSREEINPSSLQGNVTSLNCRTIRIGSYRYTPKEKVYISCKGIKIVAPSLKNESREVALQIQFREIVRILVHFGKGLPVIFLYTMSKCGAYVRKALDMIDDTGPYYNPMSMIDPYKRITLLPECISEDAKNTIKALFGKVMDELNAREANDILVRTCPRDSNNVAKITTRSMSATNSGAKSANPTEIRQILIYPPGKGGIPINTEDYMCLAQDQFLNDVIIDFYLKHLVHDILTHVQREKTHIFSTFFYKRLTTKPSKVNKISNPHEWDNSLSPAQKRHARVKTWTKNVNIFEKDFIVVPINENCHWFVAIICFPSLEGCRSMIDNRTLNPQQIKKRERRPSIQIGNTTITPLTKQEQQLTLNCDSDNLSERDEAEADESDLDMQCDSDDDETEKAEKRVEQTPIGRNEPIKQPCILIFDSLAGASRSRVVATLRDYLTCEYQAKICKNKVFNKDNIKGSCPKIPQQNNFTDCGLYLLQYVEHFFKDPILDYSLPIKQLANWFDEIVVTRKREEISILLKALMHRYNPDSHLALPDITFPTLNGKLIENEEQQEEASDGDKGNSSKSSKSDKDCEPPALTFVKQSTGDIVVKRNFTDASDTIHLRKTIRLSSDTENKTMVPIKKNDNENKIFIPLKLHTSEVVKDFQNTLLVTKNKTLGDKKYGVHNQNVSSVNCIRQNSSDSDGNMFLKARRINKLEDINESSKKFKRNEC